MNYDIHVGAILSLPGRIAAFLAALIVASFPLPAFISGGEKERKKLQLPLLWLKEWE
jgi:hypothetical protein